jgi:hypothetical protein
LQKSPDSVIEIDVRVEDGRFYFTRFFCALGPCITGYVNINFLRNSIIVYLTYIITGNRGRGKT